jgi:hypothetical protein
MNRVKSANSGKTSKQQTTSRTRLASGIRGTSSCRAEVLTFMAGAGAGKFVDSKAVCHTNRLLNFYCKLNARKSQALAVNGKPKYIKICKNRKSLP